jgi:cyclopropane-fatty-acyl-phospholipid synthase
MGRIEMIARPVRIDPHTNSISLAESSGHSCIALRRLLSKKSLSSAEKSSSPRTVDRLLALARVEVNGRNLWDIQIHDERTFARVLAFGSLGLGESYMDGWGDCAALDEFFHRILCAGLDRWITPGEKLQAPRARLFNLQTRERSRRVAAEHYDLGNAFFAAMLDSRMQYSCGYWKAAATLEQAQAAKLD